MYSHNDPIQGSSSQLEIFQKFISELDLHMNELAGGDVQDKHTVRQFARRLHIHPIHLTNVIKKVTGRTPCSFYKEKLIDTAKQLLSDSSLSIAQIALNLTFDPSNFSKFFKRAAGVSPAHYRADTKLVKPTI